MTARSADIGFFRGIEQARIEESLHLGRNKAESHNFKVTPCNKVILRHTQRTTCLGNVNRNKARCNGLRRDGIESNDACEPSIRSTSRPISNRQLGAVHNHPCSCPTTQKPRPSRMRSTSTRPTLCRVAFRFAFLSKEQLLLTGRSASGPLRHRTRFTTHSVNE